MGHGFMLVMATKGRDKGRVLLAVGEEDGYLLLADGKRRKLEKPKRKNLRHVKPLGDSGLKPEAALALTNAGVRRLLAAYRADNIQGGT